MANRQQLFALSLFQRIESNAKRLRQIASKLGLTTCCSDINNILDIPASFQVKVLHELMSKECRELLRYEADMVILMAPALQLHLAFGPRVVDLTAYVSFCPIQLKHQYLKSAVVQIAQLAPNIEELILKSRSPREYRIYDSAVDSEMLEALGKLTKLKVLQLEDWCCFHIYDLLAVCEKLPHLHTLSIVFHEDFSDIEFEDAKAEERALEDALLKSMPNVENFIYCEQFYYLFRRLCLKTLPNLKAVMKYSTPTDSDDNICGAVLRNNNIPAISNLQHLFLDFDYDAPHERMHQEMPNVNYLEVKWSKEEDKMDFLTEEDRSYWKDLLKFQQMNSLHFIDFPLHIVNVFLETYGLNLKALILETPPSTLHCLREIMLACPKLEILQINTAINDLEPIEDFAQIKEVDLNLNMLSSERNELLNILLAPGLEKVTLHGDHLSVGDLEKLTLAVIKKEIMQAVKCLTIELDAHYLDLVDSDHFKGLTEFIKRAGESLGQLTSLKFFMNRHRSEYSILARSLRHEKIENEEYPDVIDFFSAVLLNEERKSFFIDEELIFILESFAA